MTEATVTLDRTEVSKMTGMQLIKRVGILKNSTWRHHDERDFIMERRTWHVYTTAGRGRKSGTTYVHMWRKTVLRIVDTDGVDTGGRVDDVVHYRGKMADKIGAFLRVD